MANEATPIIAFTLDFETGGLKCQEHACTQIAIHAVRIDTFETVDRYVKYIYPYNKQEDKGKAKRKVLKKKYEEDEGELIGYTDVALEYSAITMDMLYSMGEEISVVAAEVIEFIKKNSIAKGRNLKPFLIGQNIGFDIGFMQQLMEYGGMAKEWQSVMRGQVDFYGNFQPLYVDTIVLGQLALSHLPDVNSYKLEIMAERLGVELNDAHDADADVAATTNVAAVLSQRMRNTEGGSGEGSVVMTKTEKSRPHFRI